MRNFVLAAVLLGGGAYLFLRRRAGAPLLPELFGSPAVYGIDPLTGYPYGYPAGAPSPFTSGGYAGMAPPRVQSYRPLMPASSPAQAPRPASPPTNTTPSWAAPLGIGTSAGTSIAGAAVAGTLSTTALLATGIGAAGAILTWAIVSKGFLRGGEEGIYVNPARDSFLSNFAVIDQWRDKNNPPGFSGLAALTHQLEGTDRLAVAVFQADSKDEFHAAVDAATARLTRDPRATAAAWDYLRGLSPF